ncbi:hypothetical protein AB1N83_013556 [Pleurotus pulmonarius]
MNGDTSANGKREKERNRRVVRIRMQATRIPRELAERLRCRGRERRNNTNRPRSTELQRHTRRSASRERKRGSKRRGIAQLRTPDPNEPGIFEAGERRVSPHETPSQPEMDAHKSPVESARYDEREIRGNEGNEAGRAETTANVRTPFATQWDHASVKKKWRQGKSKRGRESNRRRKGNT